MRKSRKTRKTEGKGGGDRWQHAGRRYPRPFLGFMSFSIFAFLDENRADELEILDHWTRIGIKSRVI